MVQAERDQHPVDEAVEEGAERARAADELADRGQAGVEDRVEVAEDEAEEEAGEGDDDRHEAPAAEEAEVGRQLDRVVPVEEGRGDEADEDPAEDGVVDHRLPAARGLLPFEHERRHRLEDRLDDEVAGDGREGGRPVRLAGEADRDADGEEDRQVREDRAARRAHGLEEGADDRGVDLAEEVGLAEPEQDAGRRQQRDRQHQALAEPLELGEPGDPQAPGRRCGALRRGCRRAHGTPSSSSAGTGRARWPGPVERLAQT